MKNAGSTWVAMIVGTVGLLGASVGPTASANPSAPAAAKASKPAKAPKPAKAKKPPAAAAADHCAIDDLGFGTMLAKKSDAPAAPAKSGKAKVDTIAQSKAAADKFDLGRKSRNADRPTDGNEVKMQSKTLSLNAVAGVVTARQSDLEYCLMQVPEKERGSEEFTLHLTIAANGSVVDAKVGGAEIAEKIDTCVQSQAKRWTFPQADAPTVIDYPLAFHVSN